MRSATLIALCEVVQKFGYWVDSGNQQVISGTGTRNVEQLPLDVVDLQISVVANRLNALLQGNYFVVAGHHDHRPKLKTFREVHGANRDVAASGFDTFIENLESHARFLVAVRARSNCAADRTNTPNSCGSTPPFACSAIQFPTVLTSSASLMND
jgi:hypothetical protein